MFHTRYGIADKDFRSTLDELVELLDVGHVMRKPTRQLSLGERMKCEFIMAMLHKPEIVFLDEPTIGLDVIAKESIRRFVRTMNEEGVTFVLTTHDLDDVEELARRVIVINHGEIIFDDGLSALKGVLGDKKIVRLAAQTALPDSFGSGVTAIERISAAEMKLEIDTSILPLNDFIRACSERTVIVDMSIEEMPIENAIKVLYAKGRSAAET
jgi:ABC-2 type transport system ATP-binding protein